MAARTPKFTAVPNISQEGLPDAQFAIFNALKENVDLLIGARGGDASAMAAVTRGSITVNPAPEMTMKRVSAEGAGFAININNQIFNVAGHEDYVKLIVDVQQLANDVATLRDVLNALIRQLKGR